MLNSSNIRNTPYSVLHLLPYSSNAIINNRQQKLRTLYFVQSILNLSKLAMDFFIRGDLFYFDAQVGENMCEIRAHKNLFLANKLCGTDHAIKADLSILKGKIMLIVEIIQELENKVRSNSFHSKELDSNEELNSFLKRNNLFFNLSEDAIYIITCYFLSNFCIREHSLPIGMDYTFITKKLQVSKNIAKRLTQKYQAIISKLGVDFVFNIAKNMENFSAYVDLFPLVHKTSDDNREVLPCLFTSEILLSHCIAEKIPIFLIIHRKTVNDKTIDFIHTTIASDKQYAFKSIADQINNNTFCIVMLGDIIYNIDSYVENQNKCLDRLIKLFPDYLLANMASHPQYTGFTLSSLKDDPFKGCIYSEKEYLIKKHRQNIIDMKNLSAALGCAKRIPTTLLLRHIYASTIEFEINRLQDMASKSKASSIHSYEAIK